MSSDFLEIARRTLAELGYETATKATEATKGPLRSHMSLLSHARNCAHGACSPALPEVSEAIADVCRLVPGIAPAQFMAVLDAEDLAELAGGEISPESLRAFAVSFAGGIASGRIRFDGDWLVHHGASYPLPAGGRAAPGTPPRLEA